MAAEIRIQRGKPLGDGEDESQRLVRLLEPCDDYICQRKLFSSRIRSMVHPDIDHVVLEAQESVLFKVEDDLLHGLCSSIKCDYKGAIPHFDVSPKLENTRERLKQTSNNLVLGVEELCTLIRSQIHGDQELYTRIQSQTKYVKLYGGEGLYDNCDELLYRIKYFSGRMTVAGNDLLHDACHDNVLDCETIALLQAQEASMWAEWRDIFRDIFKGAAPNWVCESDGVCGICLDDLERWFQPTKLQCLHTFHSTCINEWKECKNGCPVCHSKNDVIYHVLVKRILRLEQKNQRTFVDIAITDLPAAYPMGK
ncbi:hypothetical protein AMTR_s00016p00244030 [Amborella trichopoda]|uniref:RING-type E3 ubiquitin transferase n=1 Tax=Amborella trichopoda TaxID=13333 RepID=W1PGY0_AMBTC|nr:hypothetical protein AMTR_s00016p00244030 [Amborella trichopoda]